MVLSVHKSEPLYLWRFTLDFKLVKIKRFQLLFCILYFDEKYVYQK